MCTCNQNDAQWLSIPLQMVWSEVCRVVQRDVVCRKSTALVNVMCYQKEVHPERKITFKLQKTNSKVTVFDGFLIKVQIFTAVARRLFAICR